MSRWGPRHEDRRSSSPPSASSSDPIVPVHLSNDEGDRGFELIDAVEWGDPNNPFSEDGDELAIKPKPDRNDDPCVCTRPEDGSLTCNDLSCVLFACQEECRSSCMMGDFCGNKRIQRREWKNVEVFDAGKKGRGLRLLEDVSKGDFMLEYVGRAIPKHFLSQLFHRYSNERRLYIMALDNNVYLDARKRGGIARYINHSCEPNCVVERWKVRGTLRAAVIATQDMTAGTELSFDYQWERKRGRAPTKCHCRTVSCRGTLEVPRSMEEEALERQLSTHWTKPLILRARNEIVNRCVRVWSKETQEYFIADVSAFDENTGKHLLMYRHDLEEVWENLKTEDWMILDEEATKYIINRKKPKTESDQRSAQGSLLDGVASSASYPNMLLQGQKAKNYIYVQTSIKEALFSKHLVDRCQRSCQVLITPQQFAKPPLPPDPNDVEDQEKYAALAHSDDGTVWKMNIVGMDIMKAHNILEKNVAYLEKQLGMVGTGLLNGNTAIDSFGGVASESQGVGAEVVLPRSIVESVKRRLAALRQLCRNVTITFVPSESKSKQFAKLIVEGALQTDVDAANDQLWRSLNLACEENDTPKSSSGMYVDLGYLGGELSSSEFHRLLEYDKIRASMPSSRSSNSSPRSQSAKEDLSRWSPFFSSFESSQRCTIWVQSDSDKGRIDSLNRVVGEATAKTPKKIYFGCDPKTIPKLWNMVKQRAGEVARGVKYLYLGADRLYQPMMMRNGGEFFEFVRCVTGASVTVDSMTGDHLRIDGNGLSIQATGDLPNRTTEAFEVPENVSEWERAALAEELIRLQIELYRDHCVRQQSWIFGQDWTLARRSIPQGNTNDMSTDAFQRNGNSATSRSLQFDTKSTANACLEIADIIARMEISGSIAAHAAIIFYRLATKLSQPDSAESQLKMREIELACIFIANKAQKKAKWKKLDIILQSAYTIFYPGVTFDAEKEEVLVWEEKVISAEREVLETLEYDVFWRGFDWIVSAAVEAGKMDVRLAKETLKFCVSGPVLAAGGELWLTYGAEYVFVAAAAFLDAPLEKLFPTMSLIPFKVHQAAEMISSAMKNTSFSKIQSSHSLFVEGKKGLTKRLPGIKDVCAKSMASFVPGYKMEQMSEKEQRYRLLGQHGKLRRSFKALHPEMIKSVILPSLDGIIAESNCSIFIEKSGGTELEEIILTGSWREIAIASFHLQETVGREVNLVAVDDASCVSHSQNSIQAKDQPGLLSMKKLETGDGWADTIQSQLSTQAFWGRKTGGKSCLPAKIKEADLRRGGLRWWIPPRYGPCPTGTICSLFMLRTGSANKLEALASLIHAFQGESAAFSMLTSMIGKRPVSDGASDRFVAVSLHRWPSEKVSKREGGREKKEDKAKKMKRQWQNGFSPGALQELQLLHRIHGLIRSPQGHPNFLLPISVALPVQEEHNGATGLSGTKPFDINLKRLDEDIISLTRSYRESEVEAEKERKRKDMVTGPHLVFHPTPFVLQRFTVRKKNADGRVDQLMTPAIFSSWTHDLLSALLHCHCNDIILRNFLSDQIMVDHSGVVKLGSFYRATVLSKEEKHVNILQAARDRKKEAKKSKRDDEDEVISNPYVAPEMLLGSPKFTKETDIWTLGCLLCHLLLGKPIYTGKERQSVLQSIYKLVGTPCSDFYKDGTRFPYFVKQKKKYPPGVVKALTHMMKDEVNGANASAFDLISQMLALDPKKRISAKSALQHEYMQQHVEQSVSRAYQDEFVNDWVSLKHRLMGPSKSEKNEQQNREKNLKRKAMLLAANQNSMGGDDLYDMNDILGDGEKASKVPRV